MADMNVKQKIIAELVDSLSEYWVRMIRTNEDYDDRTLISADSWYSGQKVLAAIALGIDPCSDAMDDFILENVRQDAQRMTYEKLHNLYKISNRWG